MINVNDSMLLNPENVVIAEKKNSVYKLTLSNGKILYVNEELFNEIIQYEPGGGGTTYTAGDGIEITEDVISADLRDYKKRMGTTNVQPYDVNIESYNTTFKSWNDTKITQLTFSSAEELTYDANETYYRIVNDKYVIYTNVTADNFDNLKTRLFVATENTITFPKQSGTVALAGGGGIPHCYFVYFESTVSANTYKVSTIIFSNVDLTDEQISSILDTQITGKSFYELLNLPDASRFILIGFNGSSSVYTRLIISHANESIMGYSTSGYTFFSTLTVKNMVKYF